MNKNAAIKVAGLVAVAQLFGAVAGNMTREEPADSGNAGYFLTMQIANKKLPALAASGGRGRDILEEIFVKGGEDYFKQGLQAYERTTRQPLPPAIAAMEYNGAFLEECRAQGAGGPESIAACSVKAISADKNQALGVWAGIGFGIPFLIGGGIFCAGAFRRAAVKRVERAAAAQEASFEVEVVLSNEMPNLDLPAPQAAPELDDDALLAREMPELDGLAPPAPVPPASASAKPKAQKIEL